MSEKREGRVVKVAGPVVVAEGMAGARMYDVVRVGALNLIGENLASPLALDLLDRCLRLTM